MSEFYQLRCRLPLSIQTVHNRYIFMTARCTGDTLNGESHLKKSIIVAALVLYIICQMLPQAYGRDKGIHDFRNTRWGMSPAQIKLTEEGNPIGEGPLPPYDLAISYKGNLEGSDAEIGYMFNADKLVLAGYAFTERHEDNSLYVKDYEKIKALLSKKYGPPAQDNEIWADETKKAKPEGYGNAVADGALVLQSSWSVPGTDIYLTLKSDGGNVTFSALYYSAELNPLAIERKFRNTAEGF